MYIASAVYYSKEFKATRLKICTSDEADSHDRNPDKGVICLHYLSELSQKIMRLAATRTLPVEFDFHGDTCKLISYAFNSEERCYNKYRKEFVSEMVKMHPYRDEIIIYIGRCRCPKCYPQYGYDSIEKICGVFQLEKGGTAKVDLQRCRNCLTYFIDRQSLEIYERRFGRLNIQRHSMEEFVRRPSTWTDGVFAEDSILSRNGYLAEYSEEVRRRALECMLENGVTKAEIKNKLTEFIELREERCPRAAQIWRADLEFVNEYCLESQCHVVFCARGNVGNNF